MRPGRVRPIIVLVALALSACWSGRRGDPAHGALLFAGAQWSRPGAQLSCVECHLTAPGPPTLLGPSLIGVGTRAQTTVDGQSASQYLREAILNPDAHLAGGFQEGIMPRNYAQVLTDDEIADLVAFMLTLTDPE